MGALDIAGIGSVADLVKDVADKIWPDPAARAQAELQIQMLDNQLAQGQMAINQVEAANDNLFVSGWRPFVGWGSGIAFIYSTLILPIIMCILAVKGITIVMPDINTSLLETVLLGMLGLRGFEKMGDKGHLPWQK